MNAYVLTHPGDPNKFLKRISWLYGEPVFTDDLLEASFFRDLQEAEEIAYQYNLQVQLCVIRRGCVETKKEEY